MKTRPNILFIMSDQHHADCLSVTGKRGVRTPNLDKLARSGVRFERAYSNNPICSPSRISFHTGQYCHTHGMLGNDHHMYEGETDETLGMRFRRHGYQTALIGKSHMVGKWDRAGFEHIRYCDLCDAEPMNPCSNHYFKYLVDRGLADRYGEGSAAPDSDYTKNQHGIADLSYEHSIEHWTGEETLKFLAGRDKSKPFFVHMTFQRPHPPFTPAPEHKDMYDPAKIDLPAGSEDAYERDFASKPAARKRRMQRRRVPPDHLRKILAAYYTLTTEIDAEIGRVLATLEQRGELANTVVVYTADHGDFAGDHGIFRKNIGTYESIHRIPFLLAFPGCPSKVEENAIIESVDLYPTLCELADIPVPDHVDGTSLLPVVGGRSEGKPFALSEWDRSTGLLAALRTHEYRLVWQADGAAGELYCHATDPGELDNLWDDPAHAATRDELLALLKTRTAAYAPRTTVQRDRALGKQNEQTPTYQLHKHCAKWSDVKDRCRARA